MADFTYRFDGYFFRILPETPAAEDAWRKISEHFPAGAIDCPAWESVKAQLRAAGYSVRKAPRPAKNALSDAELLAALEA